MNQTERQLQWLQQHGYVRRDELDFLPVLKRGDSYAVCLDEGVRFGGFPFRRQARFIG